MFRTYLKAILLSVCLLFAGALVSQTKVNIDGKAYTVHQVRSGETFYSIAQTYKVQVDSLRSVNRLMDETAALHPGDMLVVPLYAVKVEGVAPITTSTSTVVAPVPAPVAPVTRANGYIQHTVVTGETLYSVARLYPHTTVAAIKDLNKLAVEGLSIGQVLLIPSSKPTPVTPTAPKYTTPPAGQPAIDSNALFTPNKPSGNLAPAVNSNDALVSDDGGASVASFDLVMLSDLKVKYNASVANANEQVVKGTAGWLNDPSHENQYRFYALHKTAPIGSVLKVRNLMNDRVIYAKVIGKLPNNKSNESIIVKVSGGAARYLNVLDDKFMVELSMPQAKL
jgi:LysM repeat protein